MFSFDLLVTALWGAFLFVMLVYALITVILRYHWSRFAIDRVKIIGISFKYFVSSAVLILLVLISLGLYTLSL